MQIFSILCQKLFEEMKNTTGQLSFYDIDDKYIQNMWQEKNVTENETWK